MPIKQVDTLDYLSHHGIKGQKWGVRHGPPYPLTAQAKAKAYPKKDKGSTRFGSQEDDSGKKKSGLNIDKKTLAKVAAISAVAAATLIVAPKIIRAVQSKGGSGLSLSANADKLLAGRETEKIDPDTGLYLKKEDLGINDDLKKINPNFKKGEAFQYNCALCTAAMEMRRRGYDVAASGLENVSNGGVSIDETSTWFKPPRYYEPFLTGLTGEGANKFSELKAAVKAQGNGARGEITVSWAGNGAGHSMFYQVENGSMVIYDGQSGEKFDGSKVDKLLNKTVFAMIRRLDDLEPDMDAMKNGLHNPLC